MTVSDTLKALEEMGNPGTKKVLMNHGAREPFFGVKVGDLKKIQKKVKKDHDLALALWETGNSDAMYLAGLIADENKVTAEELRKWANEAYWYMLSEYTVAWLAADSGHGEKLADEWIESKNERIASTGWATWSSVISIQNYSPDLAKLRSLMETAETRIKVGESRLNYTLNGFILAVGSFIPELTQEALDAGNRIGKVKVFMGNTACKVPFVPEYLEKMIKMDKIGNRKKVARC